MAQSRQHSTVLGLSHTISVIPVSPRSACGPRPSGVCCSAPTGGEKSQANASGVFWETDMSHLTALQPGLWAGCALARPGRPAPPRGYQCETRGRRAPVVPPLSSCREPTLQQDVTTFGLSTAPPFNYFGSVEPSTDIQTTPLTEEVSKKIHVEIFKHKMNSFKN